jgi:hypothetical protein
MSQLQGIQATGTQNAFQNAQQQQQFGANLGLQGYQTGLQGLGQTMQGAGQLASIGGQQQSADLARLQAQQAVGAQQQTLEQNKINQAIQDYATAQQYPYMQLGIMNAMLRGLPLQQTTTSSYQQQPSTTQQLAGLGGAALSYLGKKEGGVIGMKEGGTVPGYKYGDLISDPQLQGMSQNLSPQQLQGRINDPQVTPNERGIFQGTQQAQQRLASNPAAAQQMAQGMAPPQAPQAPMMEDRMGGIAAAGGGLFNSMNMAGGGIVAFADTNPDNETAMPIKEKKQISGEELQRLLGISPFSTESPRTRAAKADKKTVPIVETAQDTEREAPGQLAIAPKKEVKAAPSTTVPPTTYTSPATAAPKPAEKTRAGMLSEYEAMMEGRGFKTGMTPEEQAQAEYIRKQQGDTDKVMDRKERANMAKAFLAMGRNPRGFTQGAIDAAESYITGAGDIAASKEAREKALVDAAAANAAGQRARAAGDIKTANDMFAKEAEIRKDLQIATMSKEASLGAAGIHAAAAGKAQALEEAKVAAYMKDHPGATRSEAYAAVSQYSRGETNDINRIRYADAVLNDDVEYMKFKNSKKPEDQAKAAEIRRKTYERYGVTLPSSTGGAAATSAGAAPGVIKFDQNGNLVKG